MRQYVSSLLLLAGFALILVPTAAPQTAGNPGWENEDVAGPAAGGAPPLLSPNQFEEVHSAYLRDSSLQLERPQQPIEPPATPRPPPPGWLQSLARFLESLGPFFRMVSYIGFSVVLLALIWFLFGEAIRMRLGWTRKDKTSGPPTLDLTYRPESSAARSLLESADQLAADGRFAEAVHLLLFRSIEDVQTRLDSGVPDSFTAREIASLSQLPQSMQRGLLPIIRIVERSFFGGRTVDRAGWEEARRSYESFAFGGA